MIFSIGDHIPQIIVGTKIETRRNSDRYKVGSLQPIQRKMYTPGIKIGKIEILSKKKEYRRNGDITAYAAKLEGGYTPKKFEKLYLGLYPKWKKRTVYRFKYVPNPYLKYCDNPDCSVNGKRTVIPNTILQCWICGQSQQNITIF